jgi:hypothetical protein
VELTTVLLLLGIGAWIAWSRHVADRKRQERAAAEAAARAAEQRKQRNEELAMLEVQQGKGELTEWWRFHFPSMQLKIETYRTSIPLNFRRTKDADWQYQLPQSEVETAIRESRLGNLGDPKDPDYVEPSEEDKALQKTREKEIRSRPWSAIPSDIASRVETHYQRFVAHYETT